MAQENMINLGISPELVKPIVENQIKAIVTEALGGTDELVSKFVGALIHQKCDANGVINKDQFYNKYDWFEWAIAGVIREAVKAEIIDQLKLMASPIRKSIIKKLRSEQGANVVADALLNGLQGSFEDVWRTKIDVKLTPNTND